VEPNLFQKQCFELGEDSGIWKREAKISQAQLDLGRVPQAGQLNDADGLIVQGRRIIDNRELADWRTGMCGVRGEGGVDSGGNSGAAKPDPGVLKCISRLY
jgi:hypothetical protein